MDRIKKIPFDAKRLEPPGAFLVQKKGGHYEKV
jgi:hypothetical protein